MANAEAALAWSGALRGLRSLWTALSFLERTGGLLVCELAASSTPEAAGVCLRIGRVASLVPWQPSLFIEQLASCGVCLFGCFIPIPPKSGLEAVDGGLPLPRGSPPFFAETKYRLVRL